MTWSPDKSNPIRLEATAENIKEMMFSAMRAGYRVHVDVDDTGMQFIRINNSQCGIISNNDIFSSGIMLNTGE